MENLLKILCLVKFSRENIENLACCLKSLDGIYGILLEKEYKTLEKGAESFQLNDKTRLSLLKAANL